MGITQPQSGNLDQLSIEEQRERLINDNPDKLLSTFSQSINDWMLEFNFRPNILACYRSHIDSWALILPEDFDNWDIIIIDLAEIRQKKIKVLKWDPRKWANNYTDGTLVLMSAWVLEYYESDKGIKHIQLMQRDAWTSNKWGDNKEMIAQWAFTITHWGNFSWDLDADLEVELSEESPFLMEDDKWNYYLVTHDLKLKDRLIASINYFLENKYLTVEDEGYKDAKALFERKFRWITYEELWDILREIIETDSICPYESEAWTIKWIESTPFKIDQRRYDRYHMAYCEEYNTYDYISVRRITWLPTQLKPVGRIPQRLYLESSAQNPVTERLNNVWIKKPLVPMLEYIKDRVRMALTQ